MLLKIPPRDIPGFTELVIELSLLYARDETEKANISAAEILKKRFDADSAAVFYENSRGQYRFCLAGARFPISIPAERWFECLKPIGDTGSVSRFGPWTLPGFESQIAYWLAVRLQAAGKTLGFIVLGKSGEDWAPHRDTQLPIISRIVEAILDIRVRKAEAESSAKITEERFQTLFTHSPDMVYTADARDRVTSINPAGLSLLGAEWATDILGKPVASFLADPDSRPYLVKRAIRNSGNAENEIIIKNRRSGENLFCLESISVIRDGAGEITEIQGIVKDITQRIMNEQELHRSNIEMVELTTKLQATQAMMVQQEKLASIGQLAAGVAHEINNPLGFLKSNQSTLVRYLAKLRDAWVDYGDGQEGLTRRMEERYHLSELFSDLDAIAEESAEGFERIVKIVTGLRAFSRIDQTEQLELFDVEKGLESTLVVAQNEIKYVAEVEKAFSSVEPIMARGNELNQVFLNILVNAAQAIKSQGRSEKGHIRIATESLPGTDSEPAFLRITIDDDGPGIPDNVRSRIFEPFFTTKGPGEGTGLGLNISYNIIVNHHHGRIQALPIKTGGTRFVINLPVTTEDTQAEAVEEIG